MSGINLALRETSMKKLTALFLTVCVTAVMMGCGGEEKGGGAKPKETPKPAASDKK